MVFTTSRLRTIDTGLKLYRYLLRECKKLPEDAGKFYKFSIKQSYKQHVNESDPVRIHEIIERALEDAQWVKEKYNIDKK